MEGGLLQNANSAADLFSLFAYSCCPVSVEKLLSFCNLGYSKTDPAENGSVRTRKLILFFVRLREFQKDGSANDSFPASSIAFSD